MSPEWTPGATNSAMTFNEVILQEEDREKHCFTRIRFAIDYHGNRSMVI
jgi:hypothetical protein